MASLVPASRPPRIDWVETRKVVAELLGTFLLVFFGVGSAVFGINRIGAVGVALSFGLALLALAYAIGPVSACHINPAVTLGVLLTGGVDRAQAIRYWIAQVLGGILGAIVIRGLVGFGHVSDQTDALGTNSWGKTISGPGAFTLEVILTFALVLVVLLVTRAGAAPGFAGLPIGFTLVIIHLVGIPLDGTSVNPARSLGPALIHGGAPLHQVWLFLLAPLVGGALAAAVTTVLHPETDNADHDPTNATN